MHRLLCMKRKGMSLPLETVVLLVLAAIVLAALLGFFRGAFAPAQTETQLTQTQLRVCQEIQQRGCTTLDAISWAKTNLLDTGTCNKGRPSCSPIAVGAVQGQTDQERCVRSCCALLCS